MGYFDKLEDNPLPPDPSTSPNLSPEQRQVYDDARTLLRYHTEPNLSNFFNTALLAGRIFGERTNPTRGDDIQLGIMPNLPNPGGLPLTKVMKGDQPRQVYQASNFPTEGPAMNESGGFIFDSKPGMRQWWKSRGESVYGAQRPGTPINRETGFAAGSGHKPDTRAKPNITPAYLDITNPLDMAVKPDRATLRLLDNAVKKMGGSPVPETWKENMKSGDLEGLLWDSGIDARALLQRAGFDGIRFPNGSWEAFYPQQIINPYQYQQMIRKMGK